MALHGRHVELARIIQFLAAFGEVTKSGIGHLHVFVSVSHLRSPLQVHYFLAVGLTPYEPIYKSQLTHVEVVPNTLFESH